MTIIKNYIHRFWHFEYWPFWAFYLPVFIFWPVFSLRGRSILFFTSVNPSIPHGGCFGESKNEILKLISPEFLPRTLYIHSAGSLSDQADLYRFPVVLKPDIGERGDNIRIVNSVEEILSYSENLNRPFLIQEFITFPHELGVMVVKDPKTDDFKVTSIVSKKFLSVSGDGKSSLRELMIAIPRARFQMKRLEGMLDLSVIPSLGEVVVLEPIGNHKRGTTFINSNHLIDKNVTETFRKISSSIPGFYFGRFDIKVADLESFKRGKDIRIMELNGAFSEPGHIYDPQISLLEAWTDLLINWWDLSGIAKQNHLLGQKPTSFSEFAGLYFEYRKLQHLESAYE